MTIETRLGGISPVRRLEMALEFLSGTIGGALADLDGMKRFHSISKRGSNYTRHLESLERRLTGASAEIQEVLDENRRNKEAPS